MSNRGKFTLSKGYLKAKKSDRCRSVKYKITFLILFKSLVLMKLSYKSFVTLGENVNLGFENKKN